MDQQELTMPDAIYQELTRRAARRPAYGRNANAEYLLLLDVCQEILHQQPRNMEDLDKVEEQLAEGLIDLAEAVQMILPGGLVEFQSYLSQAAARRRLRHTSVRPPRQLYRNV